MSKKVKMVIACSGVAILALGGFGYWQTHKPVVVPAPAPVVVAPVVDPVVAPVSAPVTAPVAAVPVDLSNNALTQAAAARGIAVPAPVAAPAAPVVAPPPAPAARVAVPKPEHKPAKHMSEAALRAMALQKGN